MKFSFFATAAIICSGFSPSGGGGNQRYLAQASQIWLQYHPVLAGDYSDLNGLAMILSQQSGDSAGRCIGPKMNQSKHSNTQNCASSSNPQPLTEIINTNTKMKYPRVGKKDRDG